ncbi:MAG: DUF922 domain-containing protein [Methanothrix sp.]
MIINKLCPVDHSFPDAAVSYYDITGSTAEELRSRLNILRPSDPNGHRYDAVTLWSINWNWPGRGSILCRLDKATVSYKIKVVFPRWISPKNTSSELVTKWGNYICALAEHERGHVNIFINNHHLVANAIKNANYYTADSAAHVVIGHLKQLDAEYDAITDHGASQGARFP